MVLHRGRLVLFVDRSGKTARTFDELTEPEAATGAFRALVEVPRRRTRRLRIETIDDAPAASGPHAEVLQGLGFFREVDAMVYAVTPAPARARASELHPG